MTARPREFSTDRDPSPLKPPVWTWEVPAYFFAGGVAGLSAVIALVASLTGSDAGTVTAARWAAAIGAAVSPLLLISDLGRPSRFVYMLRVFKPTSAMSVGAWTLVLFSGATFSALALSLLLPSGTATRVVVTAFDVIAAASGLVLATYTGVLLGATVIPVWARHHRLLPFEFGISSLGAAASVIELAGGFTAPLHRVALAAAAVKAALWLIGAARGIAIVEPGRRNLIARAAWLSGPIALGLRLVGSTWVPIRGVAAIAAIAGALLLRFGWLDAGRTGAVSVRK
jgi:formate-dependent nitrite reductase membrane component NrfD